MLTKKFPSPHIPKQSFQTNTRMLISLTRRLESYAQACIVCVESTVVKEREGNFHQEQVFLVPVKYSKQLILVDIFDTD